MSGETKGVTSPLKAHAHNGEEDACAGGHERKREPWSSHSFRFLSLLAAQGYVFVPPGLAAKRKVITVGQPQLKDDSICCPNILVTRSYEEADGYAFS